MILIKKTKQPESHGDIYITGYNEKILGEEGWHRNVAAGFESR